MQEADVEGVAQLDRVSHGGNGMWSAAQYREEMANDRSEVLVLAGGNRGGRIAGVGAFEVVLDEGSITNVAVDPSLRRQGLGSMLVGGMMRRAVSLGLERLVLEVRADSNPAALALYRRFGFEEVGRRRGYYRLEGGGKEDALILARGRVQDEEVECFRSQGWWTATEL